jgi:hypothetical protein
MNSKGVFQILVPFVSTVLLFIAFWLLSFIVSLLGYFIIQSYPDSKYFLGNVVDFLRVNIFEYRGFSDVVNVNMVVFWVLNVILFISGELWILFNEDDF